MPEGDWRPALVAGAFLSRAQNCLQSVRDMDKQQLEGLESDLSHEAPKVMGRTATYTYPIADDYRSTITVINVQSQ